MPRPYHESLGVTPGALRRTGAMDAFVDLDSEFYVDPPLLASTRVPEFKGALDAFEGHFRNVLRLLKASHQEGDRFWTEAVRRLQFREVTHTGLGYGTASTRGSGVGEGLATALAGSARGLLRAGVDDPNIFELLGLFQEGFGPDRVSDIAVRIVLPQIAAYTARVAKALGAQTAEVEVARGFSALVPYDQHPDRWFLLLPRGVLTQLPVARDFEDIGRVCAHNSALREYVNERLGPTWRDVLRGMSKRQVRELLMENPEVVRDLLDAYRATAPSPYDFDRDPAMEIKWFAAGRDAARANPLRTPHQGHDPLDRSAVAAVVEAIIGQFKHLIELQGLWEPLWDADDRPRAEKIAQRLFLAVAQSYCEANDLDLTPEPNAGIGPVDFKVSRGWGGRVLVELKRSGNSALDHGHRKQLELYKSAEQTPLAYFVILDFGDRNQSVIEQIVRRAKRAARGGQPTSPVVVIDATRKASASRA